MKEVLEIQTKGRVSLEDFNENNYKYTLCFPGFIWYTICFNFIKWETFKDKDLWQITILNIYKMEQWKYWFLIKRENWYIEWISSPNFFKINEEEIKEKTLDEIEQELWYKVKIINNGKEKHTPSL